MFRGLWRGAREVAVKVLSQSDHKALTVTNDRLVTEIKVKLVSITARERERVCVCVCE